MLDKTERILEYKKNNSVYITSHLYADIGLSPVCDFIGDTLKMVADSTKVKQDTIVVCGVRFIAEMIKIMSPNKTVILPHPDASCPMATQILPFRIKAYREEHPDTCIVAYVNTTAALKAECDKCVTTATAAQICKNVEQDRVLFIPDKNIGEKVRDAVDKEVETWNCCCAIHDAVTSDDIRLARQLWPNAKVAAHLGCRAEVCRDADFCGAAGQIMDYCAEQDDVIIAAEVTLADRLSDAYSDKVFHKIVPDRLTCNHMKLISMDTLIRVIDDGYGEEIVVPEKVIKKTQPMIAEMLL